MPLLLELLDINGCIVTADAMSCQREIAKKITDGKGDYVLSLKENQTTFYEYVQTYFDDALKNPQWYPEKQSYETLDKGHGRIERRTYYLTSDLSGLTNAKEWFGLAGIGMVCSYIITSETEAMINDGQHRKAAIVEALQEDPQLGDETIPIVFFADKGLTHSQQIFTDLNKNAIKTSNSISELYDSRDHIAVMTREVVGRIKFLNTYTDKEKDMLGKYSSKLFTLNTFYTANKTILGTSRLNDDALPFLCNFWSAVAAHMLPWIDLERREITKIDIRENYIATQNVVIQALARVGAYFKKHTDCDVHDSIVNLENVNWQRNADIWLNRAIAPNGRIITNKNAIILIANVLKESLGIPLSDDEKNAELKYLKEVRM